MTVNEAAKELGCSPGLVYKLCDQGKIGYTRIGFRRGKIVIEPGDIKDYRESVRVEPVPAAGEPKPPPKGKPKARDYVGEWERKRGLT